jgi:suppressor of fused
MTDEAAAPDVREGAGWGALDAALGRLYPGQEPQYFAPPLPAMFGGNDPLDGVSAYLADGPPAHWHLVTFGFSELYEKESEDPDESGFGFELTLRLERAEGEAQPPPWAYNMLQNVARYVFRSGNGFEVGHQFPFNGPIALGTTTDIHAVVFALDPELGRVATPHGRVSFLQMVGITLDEASAIRAWNAKGVLDLLAEGNPQLVTSLTRPSLLADPGRAGRVAERTATEGSSSGATFATQLAVAHEGETVRLQIGARAVESVQTLLGGRIPFGRDFTVLGGDTSVLCRPADAPSLSAEGNRLVLDLTAPLARELRDGLAVRRGKYTFPSLPSLEIEVVPTDIKDARGRVVDTIG